MNRTAGDDRSLVERFLRRADQAAFRDLYARHSGAVYALVLRLAGGDETAAREIVQDTWVHAVQGLTRFRWESALRTWLCGVAINTFRHWRRHQAKTDREWPLAFDIGREDRRLAAALSRIDLERAVRALPDGYREVLVLHDIHGYTHGEIAQALDIQPGTSKSQLSRARRALRTILTHDAAHPNETHEVP